MCEERLKKIIISDKNDIRLDSVKKIIKSELANLFSNYFDMSKDDIDINIVAKANGYELIIKSKINSIYMCNCI